MMSQLSTLAIELQTLHPFTCLKHIASPRYRLKFLETLKLALRRGMFTYTVNNFVKQIMLQNRNGKLQS